MSASARLIYFKIPVESLYAPVLICLSNPLLHGAVDGALGIAFCNVIAFVIQLFTFAQSQFHLDPGIFKVQGKRNQCQTFLLKRSIQLENFTLVHQHLARTNRVLVKDVALFIGGNMHLLDKQFPVLNVTPAVLEVDLSLAQRFDLGTKQFDAGLVSLLYKIVMSCFSIDCDGLCSWLPHCLHLPQNMLKTFLLYPTSYKNASVPVRNH